VTERARHPRRQGGFTLIELLVALAIVAILAVMAIGAYDFANVKARRGAAKGCLLEAAQAMERYDADHFSYEGATLPACSADLDGHYALGFAADEPTAGTYRIEAVPQGAQASADDGCGTLSIDDTGVKGAGDGSADAIDACW
jgi:type IV pilus assembly protein PilE